MKATMMMMMRSSRLLAQRQISQIKTLPFSTRALSQSTTTTSATFSSLPNKTLVKPFPHSSYSTPFSPIERLTSRSASSTFPRVHLPAQFLSTTSSAESEGSDGGGREDSDDPVFYETSNDGESDGGWEEEEDEAEPKVGDGGSGGGIVFQGVPWGERALAIAREVLVQFGVDDLELFAFKTTPREYVYVRLDKMSSQYGCPSFEELEGYCQKYNKRLEEVGALGEIPERLAVEVSSPGADRLLKVPEDLNRFQDMAMNVCYVEDDEKLNQGEKNGVFFLESIEAETESCVWKLADVKENRDPQSKGRPLNRKRRDWRLTLPFRMHNGVTLYLEF